jgi:predicted nucleic acid-binding protein
MSNDYLGDTNFASSLFVTSRKEHLKADAFLQKVKASKGRIFLSRIALAEVEFGFELNPNIPITVKQQMTVGISAYQILDIGKHTVTPYAQIRAALFDQKCPKNKKNQIKTNLRPEFFTAVSPTAYELGIQENDLWMAAIAVERNMTLVTQDKMNQLKSVFPTLQLEDWTI